MKTKVTRLLVLFVVCACTSLSLLSQNAAVSGVPSRIVAPIDETRLVPFSGNVHPLAQARFDRGVAPGGTPTGRVTLLLQRSAAQQQALTQYLSDLQNPGSPNFHKWLTPAQYGARFGISDSDLQTVESWLESHGFKIEGVPQARNRIEFSGTFDQIRSAFHTSIHSYLVSGSSRFANASDPAIPAALAPVVAAVGPLNDFRPHSSLVRGPSAVWDSTSGRMVPQFTQLNASSPMLYVDPADAATIYDSPNKNLNGNFASANSYDGTGVVIGIAGDSNIAPQDIANYRTGFLGETTNVNLPTVVIPGDDPGFNGDETEALLDIEVAGGMAPGAKIDFYTAADTNLSAGLTNAIQGAIDDNAISILNISFGICEASAGVGQNAQFDEYFQQAAAQGISVTVSAGDGGSAGCDNFDTETAAADGLAVNALASTPFDIAVGGTDFDGLPANFSTYANEVSGGSPPYYLTAKSYIPENPWNDSTSVNIDITQNVAYQPVEGDTNIVAGGGGSSIVYPKPWFQSALTPTDGSRDLPDVSLFASNGFYSALWLICSDSEADGGAPGQYTDCQNHDGIFVDGTVFDGVGGTSASAPAFAGMLALVSQSQGGTRLGQAAGVLYRLAQSNYTAYFHDVTVGDNSVYCSSAPPECSATNHFLSGYNAGAGYDLASGLGSVDLGAVITNWNNQPLAATTTTLEINGATSSVTAVHGTSLTFATSVTPSAATGVVAVTGSNSGLFTIPLASGAGSATYNGLPGGTYNVTARYGGDANNATSTSGPISVTISPEASTTTVGISGYGFAGPSNSYPTSAIPYGSYVFLNAQITGTAEGSKTQGVATGTVNFYNSSTAVGSATVGISNTATYPGLGSNYTIFPVGTYSITAQYSGDASYNSSTSTAATFTVVKASTTTSASAAPSTINAGQSTDASVTITTPYNLGVAPTGTITLTSGGTTLATITALGVNSSPSADTYTVTGGAAIQQSQLATTGTNTITATYSGDANYKGSSTTFTVVNSSGLGSFTLSNGGNFTLQAGETANATITVTPAGGFDGPVTLSCTVPASLNATCAVPAPLTVAGSAASAGVGVAVSGTATPGTYTIGVTGVDLTGKITSSTSFTVTVTPGPEDPGITLGSTVAPTFAAGATTGNSANLILTPYNGYTGTVNITCAITTTISNPVSLPTCSSPAVAVSGTNAIPFAVQFSTTSSTTPGSYTVKVTGTAQSNSFITNNTTFTLTIYAPSSSSNNSVTISNSGNISVSPGATSGNTSTITITPATGFTGVVNLACALTGQPAKASSLPTCSLPSSVTITGSTAATATLTITTSSGASSTLAPPLSKFFLGGGVAFALVLFFGIPARQKAWRALFGLLVAIVLISGTGCGTTTSTSGNGSSGGSSGGSATAATTAGSYTFTITATSAATGAVASTTVVTVTVN